MSKVRSAFRALYYPDFRWYWLAYFVSNVGSWMHNVAQDWLLFDLTNSPSYLGLLSLTRMILFFCFFLLGGLVADRWDRRTIMIWIQLSSVATALALGILTSLGIVQVWHIFVLGALTSTAWAFEQPVRQSLVPQLVGKEDLVGALALNAVTWHGAGLLGPSLLGLLVGRIGVSGCFYVNAFSYLTIVFALARMRLPAIEEAQHRGHILQSLGDGFNYIRGERLILIVLIGSGFFSIFGRSYMILLPVFAKEVLRVGASGLGYLAAGPGLGTIIGSLSLAAVGRVTIKRRNLIFMIMAYSAILFLFATTVDMRAAFIALVIVGGLGMVFETLLHTLIQLNVADRYRGRVLGVYGLTAAGLKELGGLQGGFLAELTSAPRALETGAIILAFVGFFFLRPGLRGLLEQSKQ